jgi:hypothetical protein
MYYRRKCGGFSIAANPALTKFEKIILWKRRQVPQHQTTTGLDSGWFVRLAIHLTRYLNLLWFGVADLPPLPEKSFFEFSEIPNNTVTDPLLIKKNLFQPKSLTPIFP